MTTFSALGLSENILKGIIDAGYSTPTPIQAAAIPVAADGRDLIGCAQTGTGKTAAFVLPMLHRLSATRRQGTRYVRALVVTPTRELALQVEESVRTYGKYAGLRSVTIFGGVGYGPQEQALRRGADIVVATPGRLLDLLSRGTVDLSDVEILVLDEADRMFDMGFIHDVRRIVAAIPEDRQTLLFSATMPGPVQALANSILYDPELIEVGHRRNPAATVTQQVCAVSTEQKMDLLIHVLQTEPVESVIVFSRTKHRADRIAKKLVQRGFSAAAIHGDKSQGQRQKALEGFKKGHYSILVATDIAARGIDVDGISHVINYDTPNQPEDYIHRIGRTGRAEASGEAITFVARDEEAYLRDIERHTGRKLAWKVYDDFEPSAPVESTTQQQSRSNAPAARQGGGHGSRNGRSGQQRRAATAGRR